MGRSRRPGYLTPDEARRFLTLIEDEPLGPLYTLAMTTGKKWYYPGYIVQGLPKFDYKLFLDKSATEVFLPAEGSWIGYPEFINGQKMEMG